ncbi:MAG: DUF1826 domain-containing protein [Planctomycetota bacterium]
MERTYVDPSSGSAGVAAVVRGEELADLAELYEPEVMLVSVPFTPSPGAQRHAEAMIAARAERLSVTARVDEGAISPDALAELAPNGTPDARAWLDYVAEATLVFADLLGADLVGVRQVVADGPHCPRFHVDRVHVRGVLNVLGSCTEWVDEADLDRTRLGHAGGADDAVSGLVRRWDQLRRAESGSLTLFKGTAWPGAAEHAVVHRSPPADGTRRVLLTLDWME